MKKSSCTKMILDGKDIIQILQSVQKDERALLLKRYLEAIYNAAAKQYGVKLTATVLPFIQAEQDSA